MAAFYELRYWKNITQPDGSIIRLEIHGKGIEGISFTAYEIGPVIQALALTIQGQTEDVDAPIVKTSLTMTFVDAPDHADAWLKKCGDWEEFYTNDATMWKVILKGKKDASSSTYAQLWGGYITPDSFSEELRYRGSVTIVARDNIGHMQDFPFDAEGDENGMISLKSLVESAWAKIESPMALYWPSARWLECEGVYAFDTLMNVSAFKGKNWYEAVESALYAYGAVMRYNGENQVLLCSLRYMPQQARPSMDQVTHIEPVFIASAHRELTPAARRIEESVSFETGDGWQVPLAKGITFTGSEDDVTFLSKNVFGETTRTSIPVNPIDRIGGEGWQNDTSASLFFNPKMYTMRDAALKDDAERMIFLACNTDGSHRATFRKTVYCKDMEVRFRFGRVVQRDDLGGVQYSFGFASGTEDNGIGSIRIKKVQCYVTAEQNGITQYWTGSEWQTAAYRLELAPNEGEFGIGISFKDITGQAALSFIFENIIVDAMYDYSKGYGLYVPISTMSFGVLQGLPLCAKNNVNTNYNEKNNVIISRTPELAPAMDEVPFPAAIKNGIFYKSDGVYLPAKAWNWNGGTPQQMAVYNHLQLLCYHSKPNNLITGDILNADVIKTAAIYVWGGKEHLLISGTCNYLNGRIEGAVLREFVRYDDMWGDVTGSSLPDVETDNTTNAEEGGPSSSGVTNENTTNVVIGGEGGGSVTIDPFLSDTSSNPVESKAIKAYIDSADAEIHARIDELGQGGNGGGAEVRTLFVNDAGLSADELSYNADTYQQIFAQKPMIFFASAEEGTPLSEYELMGMDNGRMVFARYELNEFSTGATYIYLAMDGSTEVGGFSKSELDGDKYDQYLDANSTNAVQNKVVTENIRALEAAMPLMAAIDLDTIIAQDNPIDNATRNALLELGGYTSGDKYFSKGWIWSRGYLYTIKVIPTDAGVQIQLFSFKGWTEIAEDNSKVNHLPSQGGGNVEVDAELSETSENAVSNKAVTMALAETEEVTAAALNELNKRFDDYATKEDIDATLAEMDEEINHIEGVLEATIIEDEEVTAAALNDLDKRVTSLEQNGGGGGGGDIYNVSFTIDPSTMELVMAYDVQPTFDFTLDENGNLIAII